MSEVTCVLTLVLFDGSSLKREKRLMCLVLITELCPEKMPSSVELT